MKYIITAAFTFLLTPTLFGQDVGSTPYAALLKAARIDASDIAGVGKRSIRFTVGSTLPDVAPSDIRLTLVSKSKSQAIPVDESGQFLLPLSEAYLKDQSVIRTNQPKKTVRFRVSITWDRAELEFEPVENGMRIRYGDLFPSTKAFRRAVVAADEIQGNKNIDRVAIKSTRTKSVIFTTNNLRVDSSVVLDFGSRLVDLAAIKDGTYRVELRHNWLQLNPWVELQPTGGWEVEYETEPLVREKTEQ